MYCPHCGAPAQVHRFCSQCGGALQPAPPAPHPQVNVTVNVGPPQIVSPTPVPWASRIVHSAVKALVSSARTTEQLRTLRDAARRHLEQCDAMIAEIEATIALDLLPHDSPVQQRYMRALEIRQEAALQCTRAVTVAEVMAVNDQLLVILREFTLIRSSLSGSG